MIRPAHMQQQAPAIPPEPPEWTVSAACAGVDPELWFPEKGGSNGRAKKICADCPVAAPCLVYGKDERFGIYGGLTERERRGLRRGRAA